MAEAINLSPDLQDEFLDDEEFIKYYASLNHLLRANLKKKAKDLAKKLIIKVANQLVGTGSAQGHPAPA